MRYFFTLQFPPDFRLDQAQCFRKPITGSAGFSHYFESVIANQFGQLVHFGFCPHFYRKMGQAGVVCHQDVFRFEKFGHLHNFQVAITIKQQKVLKGRIMKAVFVHSKQYIVQKNTAAGRKEKKIKYNIVLYFEMIWSKKRFFSTDHGGINENM
ncbi:MAG: hypothetical protein HUJ25_10370 [Crocinitomicaceae bacterium]|nr:hypothetical protein [Crocinitomicaceae bacterium]